MENRPDELAGMAKARARIYQLFVAVFSQLPDGPFLEKIRGRELKSLLPLLSDMDRPECQSGLEYIGSYLSQIKTKADEQVLNDLSVDRTRIFRGTGHPDLKAPYEGVYKQGGDPGQVLLEVKRFYREAGIWPEQTVQEPEDYICIELDFMRQLCLKEESRWLSRGDATETIVSEEAFLSEHLGGWVSEFCRQVQEHALTDFYRGFALILEAFISTEMEYLEGLAASVSK